MVNDHSALDMTQGKPMGLILKFALPLLVGNIFQQLYNMVDSMVVGRFVGSAALAAVGTAFPILFLLSSIFLGLGMGAMVVISQYIGAGDRDSVAKAVDTIYSAMQIVVLPLTVVGMLLCGPLLRLIQVPAEAFDGAYVYCMVAFAGVVGMLGLNLNAGIMQGLGDSRTTLIFLAVACVINIVLDLAFVILLPWGVFGVALATVIAQICSWVFGVIYINRKYPFIRIKLFRFHIDRALLKQILRLGIPSAVHQCQFSVAILLMQILVNGVGTDFMAGFSAANKIDTFAFMPIQSFGSALTAYVGQNMGAGRLDRVRHGLRSTMALSVGTSLVLGWLVILFRRPLLSIFNSEPAVLAGGEAYLLRVLSLMFLFAIMFTLDSTLRGAGSTVVPMVTSIVALWGVRLPAAYLLAYFVGPEQLYWGFPLGWVVGITISSIAYFRGKWKDACVVQQSEAI